MAVPNTSGYLQATDSTKPRSDVAVPFRDIIPSPSHPRIAGVANHNALRFTSDGYVRSGLYSYAEDEGAPTELVISETERLLKILTPDERQALQRGQVIDDNFRLWSNLELYMNLVCLPLDECSGGVQSAIHAIFKALFLPQGYEKVLGCCLTNAFLGHLVNGKKFLTSIRTTSVFLVLRRYLHLGATHSSGTTSAWP